VTHGRTKPKKLYAKIATAPRAIQDVFETVIEHFNKRNASHVQQIERHSANYGESLSYLKEM